MSLLVPHHSPDRHAGQQRCCVVLCVVQVLNLISGLCSNPGVSLFQEKTSCSLSSPWNWPIPSSLLCSWPTCLPRGESASPRLWSRAFSRSTVWPPAGSTVKPATLWRTATAGWCTCPVRSTAEFFSKVAVLYVKLNGIKRPGIGISSQYWMLGVAIFKTSWDFNASGNKRVLHLVLNSSNCLHFICRVD